MTPIRPRATYCSTWNACRRTAPRPPPAGFSWGCWVGRSSSPPSLRAVAASFGWVAAIEMAESAATGARSSPPGTIPLSILPRCKVAARPVSAAAMVRSTPVSRAMGRIWAAPRAERQRWALAWWAFSVARAPARSIRAPAARRISDPAAQSAREASMEPVVARPRTLATIQMGCRARQAAAPMDMSQTSCAWGERGAVDRRGPALRPAGARLAQARIPAACWMADARGSSPALSKSPAPISPTVTSWAVRR